jgi:hypothetical protein
MKVGQKRAWQKEGTWKREDGLRTLGIGGWADLLA